MPPPPKTIRQQIVDAVVARLQTITTNNGYQTNIGAEVSEWPIAYEQEDLVALPSKAALGVFDLVNSATEDKSDSRLMQNELPLQVRIYHVKAATPAELRTMIGDVMNALSVDKRWGGLAWHTESKSDGFIIPKDSFEIDGAAVEVTIKFLSKPLSAY